MKCLIVHTSPQSITGLTATIIAAQQISDHVDAIIIGQHDTDAITGIQTIYYYPEISNPPAKLISELIETHHDGYTHILCHSDTTGKDYLPYYCGRNLHHMISDVRKIHSNHTFERAIYAGAAIQTVESSYSPQVISIRGIYFTQDIKPYSPTIETHTFSANEYQPTLVSPPKQDNKLSDLTSADVVVSGGRGFGSEDAFQQLYQLAQHFDAAVGASRAAVDAGYIGNDHQVGQTGKIIAPRLYFAFGISGAVQHLSGMKDSQTIIAVDQNPEAPIFKIAQYGLVGDLFEAIDALQSYNIKK